MQKFIRKEFAITIIKLVNSVKTAEKNNNTISEKDIPIFYCNNVSDVPINIRYNNKQTNNINSSLILYTGDIQETFNPELSKLDDFLNQFNDNDLLLSVNQLKEDIDFFNNTLIIN